MRVGQPGPGSADRARDVSTANALGDAKDKRKISKSRTAELGNTEKVAISSKAKEAAKAKEIATSVPDIDEAKVARLKSAIENGSYKVDAERIADRLVDEHLAATY